MARDPKVPNLTTITASGPISASQPVAKEVPVVASGARPASASGERELFTEATSTVLISKTGAVIRLSAAVIPGQLLFLVNQESNREVVTQVLRKRYFRPTNCYVELQFTESAVNFWGAQLPDAMSSQMDQCDVVKRVQSAEVTSDDPGKAAPVPSAREVKVLRDEVEQLRVQLQSLSQGPPVLAASRVTPAPSSAVTEDGKNYLSAPADTVEEEVIEDMNASRLPIDSPAELSRIVETLSEPYGSIRKRSPKHSSPKLQTTSGGNSLARIIPFAAGFFLLATGIAWYARLLPGLPAPKLLVASLPDTARHTNPAIVAAPAYSDGSKPSSVANEPPQSPGSRSSTTYADAARAFVRPEVPPVQIATPAPETTEKNISAMRVAKHSATSPSGKFSVAPALANEQDMVPPKLLSSVQGIAPPEAVLGFVAGNVVFDAVVGPRGRVISSTVVSGRPSLRASALETIKQYRYQPATLHGQPVPAHVTITVKCWFEP